MNKKERTERSLKNTLNVGRPLKVASSLPVRFRFLPALAQADFGWLPRRKSFCHRWSREFSERWGWFSRCFSMARWSRPPGISPGNRETRVVGYTLLPISMDKNKVLEDECSLQKGCLGIPWLLEKEYYVNVRFFDSNCCKLTVRGK